MNINPRLMILFPFLTLLPLSEQERLAAVARALSDKSRPAGSFGMGTANLPPDSLKILKKRPA